MTEVKKTTMLGHYALDAVLAKRMEDASKTDGRLEAEIVRAAIEFYLSLSPGTRKSITALEMRGSSDEKRFLSAFVGRQILRAHHIIVESRYPGQNSAAATESENEAEAISACRGPSTR